MQAARRLYLYVMSGITLAVIATGLAVLLRVVLDGVFPRPEFSDFRDTRQELSQAVAMLGVGLPVWAVHWWFVQRGVRAGASDRDAERGSAVRAIYLTGVLLISLIVWVSGAIGLLHWLATTALGGTQEFNFQDPLGSATSFVAGLVVWLYHGLVRRRDLAGDPVTGPAAWVPRLYLYGVSFGALFGAVSALTAILETALPSPAFAPDDAYLRYFLAERGISAIALGLVWLGHWRYAGRLPADPGWRGTDERVSRTRVAAFVVTIVVAATMTLIDVGRAIGAAITPLLPPDPAFPTDRSFTAALGPLVGAVLWAIVWVAHSRGLRREPVAADDPLRALHQERLVSHGVAATGLAVGATGAGWLLGYLLDLVLGGQRTALGLESSWFELAQWLPLAIVGLGTWIWFWRGVVARRRLDPVGEATSTIRRTSLYLTLAVALIAALAAAAVILYRLVGVVLGAGLGGNDVSALSTPLGGLITASAVLVYYGLQLRADQAVSASEADGTSEVAVDSAEAAAESPGIVPAASETTAGAGELQRRSLELVGPAGADLDAAVAAARAALPPGIEIVVTDA